MANHAQAHQAADRRRSPRIEIQGRVRGRLVSLDMPIVVRDMSLGGMSMETPFPLEIGSLYEFSLTLGDGTSVLLRGEVRHSRNVARAGAAPSYLSGVQFAATEAAASEATVADLIQKIT